MAVNEVLNFVNKFLNLRKNGENATLSLQCQDGSVSIISVSNFIYLPILPLISYLLIHHLILASDIILVPPM